MIYDLSLMTSNKNKRSFTLIELLVVLALVAILSVVVILTLNPSELLKQARDSNRLSDLATINTALNLFSTDVTSGFMGTSTVVYVSLPSTTSTCSNLGLPTLPAGYTYNCVTSQNLRNTDGTGWIPVNFNRISSNSPISQLPIDPTNTTSTKYYTYVTGGSWQLAVKMESQKYQATAYTSGGADPSTYTIGNNLTLAPFVGGLVGWWKFDEGSGATTTDLSGYGRKLSWYGSGSRWGVGRKDGLYSLVFNGTDDYISGTSTTLNIQGSAISFWVKLNNSYANSFGQLIFWSYFSQSSGPYLAIAEKSGRLYTYAQSIALTDVGRSMPGAWVDSGAMGAGSWHNLILSQSPNGQVIFIDGIQVKSSAFGTLGASSGINFGKSYWGLPLQAYLDATIDDLRIYSRALSATEAVNIYNAEK